MTARVRPRRLGRYTVPRRPRVLIALKKQTGRIKNKAMDRRKHALPPGKRVSRNGKVYWETRANRTDLHKWL